MYDKYDLLLVSIPSVLLFGIAADRLINTAHQIPLFISATIGLVLMLYAMFSLDISY